MQINANLRSTQEATVAGSASTNTRNDITGNPRTVSVKYEPIRDPAAEGGYLPNQYTVTINSGTQTATGVARFDPATGALASLAMNTPNNGTIAPDAATPPTQLIFTPATGDQFTMNLSDIGLATTVLSLIHI